MARKRTIDDPITPWQERREKALRESSLPTEALEKSLDELQERLEKYQSIELDSFTHTWMDADYQPLPDEQEKEYAKAVKKIRDGEHQGWEKDPQPTAKNSKIQVTVAHGTWDLLNNWASAEDRGLSEVTNAAIQAGLRALRADGAIPQSALDAYEIQCQRRISDAQARRIVTDFVDDCTSINF